MNLSTRRLMSLLLALAMTLSLAATALAEDLNGPDSVPAAAAESAEAVPEEGAAPTETAVEKQADAAENPADAPAEQTDSEEPAAAEEQSGAPEASADAACEEREEETAPELPASIALSVLESTKVEGLVCVGSSDPEVVSADKGGTLTARRVGSAVVQVADEKGALYEVPVTVEPTVHRSSAKVSVNKATTLKLKKGRKLACAESENSRIAAVNDNGEVEARRSGVVDITLTDTLGDLHVVTLTVKAVLAEDEISLSEEKTAQLELMGSDIQKVSSSDEDVVTVDEDGTLTGVQEGTAVVTLTDESGSELECEVNVEPNYLARTARNAQRIYRKIESLRCRHVSGVHTYSELVRRKHCSCTTGPSLALQAAGVLPVGKTVSHTKAGSEKRKLKNVDKGISCRKNLKKGTYTIYKANCRYSKLPSKYKQAGMVYVQDSNICVSAGGGYIYSCNGSSKQMKRGHYVRTKMKTGYTHHHKILYVIAPNS